MCHLCTAEPSILPEVYAECWTHSTTCLMQSRFSVIVCNYIFTEYVNKAAHLVYRKYFFQYLSPSCNETE